MYFSLLQYVVRLAHMNLCVVSDGSIFAQLKLNYQEMHRKWQSVISGNTKKFQYVLFDMYSRHCRTFKKRVFITPETEIDENRYRSTLSGVIPRAGPKHLVHLGGPSRNPKNATAYIENFPRNKSGNHCLSVHFVAQEWVGAFFVEGLYWTRLWASGFDYLKVSSSGSWSAMKDDV